MKIYISADIEGVAGIASWDETDPGKPDYTRYRDQMTAEVLAACEGAIAAGAKEIMVKDAHGPARNIDPAQFPECVSFSRGWSGHPFVMMDELDDSYASALMIGYHSRAGSGGSPMAHTMSSSVIGLFRINGAPASEFTINAMTAQYVGVPVVFVSGDELLSRDIEVYNEHIATVVTQRGHGNSTVSIHPGLARKRIAEEVKKSLKRDLEVCRRPLPDHFQVEIEYKDATKAYRASFYPGAKLVEHRIVSFETDDYFDVLRLINTITF